MVVVALICSQSAAAVDVTSSQKLNTTNHHSAQKQVNKYLPDPVNNRTKESFTTIQAAIDSAKTLNGDTILVESGTYHENVVLYKNLTLLAQGKVIIIPKDKTSNVITVNSTGSGSSIVGFTFITPLEEASWIYLDHSNNCKVTDNNITINGLSETGFGMQAGINLYYSNNCIIKDNTISNISSQSGAYDGILLNSGLNNFLTINHVMYCDNGISIMSSSKNTVNGNDVRNNTVNGIFLQDSGNNHLFNNIMAGNVYNLGVSSTTTMSAFVNSIDENNTVNGKPVYYLYGLNNVVINGKDPAYLHAGYIGLVACSNVVVKNFSLSDNCQGLLLAGCHDCTVTLNSFINNTVGIDLEFSDGNTVINNKNISNAQCGILIENSNSNTVTGSLNNCDLAIQLENSAFNNIDSCTLNGNNDGLALISSTGNTISSNKIKNSLEYGLVLENSANNIFYSNSLTNNKYNLAVFSTLYDVTDYYQKMDSSNTINGKPVYYLVGSNGMVIDGNSNKYKKGVGYLALVYCNNITVKNVKLSDNNDGILIVYSHNCKVTNNTIFNNYNGIELLEGGSANTIQNNNVNNNKYSGIYIEDANYNTIKNNRVNNSNIGFYIHYSSGNRIDSNQIKNNVYGIVLTEDSNNNKFSSNTITDNGVGMVLKLPHSGDDCENNTITENTISNNDVGLQSEFASNNHLNFNVITNNKDMAMSYYGQDPFDARYNWWGTNQPNFKKITEGNINTTPWIVTRIKANPTTVKTGKTSTITADMLHDNKGNIHHTNKGVVPYNGSANFKTNKGTINDVKFKNGVARTTLKNLSTGGTAIVSSKVNNQTVSVKVNVVKDNSVISVHDVTNLAANLKVYYEKNHQIPKTVKINGISCNTAQLLELMVTATTNIKNNIINPINIKKVRPAPYPKGHYNSGKLYQSSYINTAKKIKNFIKSNGQAQNYAITSIGNINFNKLVYIYSKILNYFKNNQELPNYVWVS